MKKLIRLTESDLHRIVKESVKSVLIEGKIETWEPDEFVTWDDAQYFCNHNYDTVERNEKRCEKLGIPEEQRCFFCQKALKDGYKTLYVSDNLYNPDNRYYARPNATHNSIVRLGKTCAKAFENAHKKKYGR